MLKLQRGPFSYRGQVFRPASGAAMLNLRTRARQIGRRWETPHLGLQGAAHKLCTCLWFLGVRLKPQKTGESWFSKSLTLIHPGYGVPLKDVPPEKFNSTAMPKSYQSPWEKVTGVDLVVPEPTLPRAPSQPRSDQPVYKSFNR